MADAKQTTTKKHREFVAEPIGDKPATKIPGIGPEAGGRLEKAGFRKASNVLGQYLALNQDKERFVEWLKTTAGVNGKDANDCYKGVQEWANNFM